MRNNAVNTSIFTVKVHYYSSKKDAKMYRMIVNLQSCLFLVQLPLPHFLIAKMSSVYGEAVRRPSHLLQGGGGERTATRGTQLLGLDGRVPAYLGEVFLYWAAVAPDVKYCRWMAVTY